MILPFNGKFPTIDPSAYIVDSAVIAGDVEIGAGANIWFHSIIRGDITSITIDRDCNIQDACVLHVARGHPPLILGPGVVLGHRVVVHGCHIGAGSLIGIGAIVLDGAVIGEEAIIGAGSVVSPHTIIPPRTLAMGVPAKIVRSLNENDLAMIRGMREEYRKLTEIYRGR
ncbi:MAG TPA: gamma carbonic anhydrase family protein [Syntrophorhabdaceae bacterium]|jgi:carbonic anhydrase/acetyltransferase-like protein (isoleucine patch superfamily)